MVLASIVRPFTVLSPHAASIVVCFWNLSFPSRLKVVRVVIEPYHTSTITAQGGWVRASRELESDMEEGLRWGGDLRVEFGLTMYGIIGIAKGWTTWTESVHTCHGYPRTHQLPRDVIPHYLSSMFSSATAKSFRVSGQAPHTVQLDVKGCCNFSLYFWQIWPQVFDW